MQFFNEKVKHAAKVRGIRLEDLAADFKMTRQGLNLLLKRAVIRDSVLKEMCKFLDVPAEYFTSDLPHPPVPPPSRKFEEPSATYSSFKKIPFYDVDVSASSVEMFGAKEIPSLYFAIPGFEDCDFGVPVFGHSMYPTFENGCIVACKIIHDKNLINFGASYLIITEDYRMIKRILKNDMPRAVLAVSDNEEMRKDGKRKFESFEIPLDKIRKLYLIKGKITREQI